MAFIKVKLTPKADNLKQGWQKFNQLIDDLFSTSLGKGASQIGIHDAGNIINATNVEDALQEDVANLNNHINNFNNHINDFNTHKGSTAKSQHTGGLGDHNHQTSGAEGGQLDHGLALTGLEDDDHTQYLNTTRHDTTDRHPDSVLQQITSAGKVNGSALTGLANIPSSAGNIPLANLTNAVDYTDNQAGSNQAGKINSLTEKTSLVDNDLFLIEDSENSYAKKKVKKSNVVSGGIWKKIAEIDVSSNTTSVTFSNLDGDTDGEYMIYARICSSLSNPVFYVRLNNDNGSNYPRQTIYAYGSTLGTAGGTLSGLYFCALSSGSPIAGGFGYLYAKSGKERLWVSQGTYGNPGITLNIGKWTDTSSNITSITIFSDQTNGIGAGSHIELWALR